MAVARPTSARAQKSSPGQWDSERTSARPAWAIWGGAKSPNCCCNTDRASSTECAVKSRTSGNRRFHSLPESVAHRLQIQQRSRHPRTAGQDLGRFDVQRLFRLSPGTDVKKMRTELARTAEGACHGRGRTGSRELGREARNGRGRTSSREPRPSARATRPRAHGFARATAERARN